MKEINILWLYPKEMNTYGDYGNLLTLVKRLEWRGFKALVIEHNIGDPMPLQVDLILGGGGQDSNQSKIHSDLLKIAPSLRKLADKGVPMLMVCGLYQLFGKELILSNDETLEGVNIFENMTTKAGGKRIIGNVVAKSDLFGELYGYENHSGRTILKNTPALSTVPIGVGNNGKDETEGAFYRNVIGTYLHGSVLPKNPRLADFLIETALNNRYNQNGKKNNKIKLGPLKLDKQISNKTRKILSTRPR